MVVEQNSRVRVHYTGTLEDGTQFDTSLGAEPLELQVGAGQVIPGFEAALLGMAVGENKTVDLSVDEAYGEVVPQLIQEVERTQIPPDIELNIGMQLQVEGPAGEPFVLTVTELNDTHATLDGNHPLAGRPLRFQLEVVEILAAEG